MLDGLGAATFLPVCLFERQQSCNEQGVKTEGIEPLEKEDALICSWMAVCVRVCQQKMRGHACIQNYLMSLKKTQ